MTLKASSQNRLLFVVGQLGTGGLERQLCYLIQSLDRERYRPSVLVWSGSTEGRNASLLRSLGVPVHDLSGCRSASAKMMAARRLVGQLDPEVVHSYSFYTNLAAHWVSLRRRIVPVGSIRSELGYIRSQQPGVVFRNLNLRFPRHQISNNQTAIAQSRLRPRWLRADIHLVRNGIDLQQFQVQRAPTESEPLVIGIGSLFEVKRWDLLIDAAATVARRGIRFRVIVAGGGPLRNALTARVRDCGLSERFEFIGSTDRLSDLLARASFLVHPSDSEGCPNAVVEAMASARPVVAASSGDVPYIVEAGVTGFTVPPGQSAALADRMEFLLRNREQCARMGSAARARAEREFGLKRLVSETLAVYRAAGWRESGAAAALPDPAGSVAGCTAPHAK